MKINLGETEWLGGETEGCLFETTHGTYRVIFRENEKQIVKTFKNKELANQWKKLYCVKKNKKIRNMYRFIFNKDSEYLEVKLQNNLIMKCDIKHLDLVKSRIWSAYKGKGKKTYYVKSRKSKKRNQNYNLFHKLAFPNFNEVDHINGNGLDNRSSNIREGSNRVNAINKSKLFKNNTSGIKGVYKENGKKARWCAQWNGIDGKKHKR